MMGTLDSREFTHDGRDYRVRIAPDPEASPRDYDCYSDADVAAYNNGDWRFVGVILYTLRGDDTLDSVSSLWAVEYGFIGDSHIGTDEIIQRIFAEDWFAEGAPE